MSLRELIVFLDARSDWHAALQSGIALATAHRAYLVAAYVSCDGSLARRPDAYARGAAVDDAVKTY